MAASYTFQFQYKISEPYIKAHVPQSMMTEQFLKNLHQEAQYIAEQQLKEELGDDNKVELICNKEEIDEMDKTFIVKETFIFKNEEQEQEQKEEDEDEEDEEEEESEGEEETDAIKEEEEEDEEEVLTILNRRTLKRGGR
nr:ORF50 [Acipenserid herpesvirus 1]